MKKRPQAPIIIASKSNDSRGSYETGKVCWGPSGLESISQVEWRECPCESGPLTGDTKRRTIVGCGKVRRFKRQRDKGASRLIRGRNKGVGTPGGMPGSSEEGAGFRGGGGSEGWGVARLVGLR